IRLSQSKIIKTPTYWPFLLREINTLFPNGLKESFGIRFFPNVFAMATCQMILRAIGLMHRRAGNAHPGLPIGTNGRIGNVRWVMILTMAFIFDAMAVICRVLLIDWIICRNWEWRPSI